MSRLSNVSINRGLQYTSVGYKRTIVFANINILRYFNHPLLTGIVLDLARCMTLLNWSAMPCGYLYRLVVVKRSASFIIRFLLLDLFAVERRHAARHVPPSSCSTSLSRLHTYLERFHSADLALPMTMKSSCDCSIIAASLKYNMENTPALQRSAINLLC